MQSVQAKNFREIQSMQLSECITSVDATEQYVAAGCLDEILYVWKGNLSAFDTIPVLAQRGHTMGIVDLKIDNKSTYVTVSCMDSTIRQWELDTQAHAKIQCEIMDNWKVNSIGNSIITCGNTGKITFYDNVSKQKTKKIDAGEVFLTALDVSNGSNLIAVGNDVGDLFVINLSNKDKMTQIKPHHKIIRTVAFSEDSTKLFTGSDDDTIKIVDIASQKVIGSLQGHKEGVSCVSPHPIDSRVLFSSSFDKTVKCWDARMKNSVGSVMTGSQLWTCKATNKHLITGGDSGVLSIYSIE